MNYYHQPTKAQAAAYVAKFGTERCFCPSDCDCRNVWMFSACGCDAPAHRDENK